MFLFGFAKNERENISQTQLDELKVFAAGFLQQSDSDFDEDVVRGRLQEIDYGEEH